MGHRVVYKLHEKAARKAERERRAREVFVVMGLVSSEQITRNERVGDIATRAIRRSGVRRAQRISTHEDVLTALASAGREAAYGLPVWIEHVKASAIRDVS